MEGTTPQAQESMPKHHRVLIVDDMPIVRVGLTHLLHQESDLLVCGTAENVHEGVQMLTTGYPELAIVDMSLRRGGILSLVKTLHSHAPTLPILVYTTHPTALYAMRTLQAGARAYVLKWEDTATLLQAVRQVFGGHVAVVRGMPARSCGRCAPALRRHKRRRYGS